MYTAEETKELAQWVMDRSHQAGAADVAVDINTVRSISVEHRDGELDKLQESTQHSLSLEVYAKGRYSSHSTNDTRRESLDRFITEAVAMTAYLGEDPYRKLLEPRYYQKMPRLDLALRDESYPSLSAERRIELAREIQELASAHGGKIVSVTSGFSDSDRQSIHLRSNGFSGEQRSTTFQLSVSVTVAGENGARPGAGEYCSVRHLSELGAAADLAAGAVERANGKLGQEKIASGVFDLVIENRSSSRIFGRLYGAITGRALQQKNTYLDGMIGKQVTSPLLTLIDDPLIPKGLGSRYFDSEGMASRRRVIIEDGILREYYLDSYYARKLGLEPTGGSTGNMLVKNGTRSLNEMIRGVKKGILVMDFIGSNANMTTGDFSFGIAGQLIEDGRLTKPINEMNISGNLKDLWMSLAEIGNDPFQYSSWRLPSVHFREVQFSGI